MKIAIIISGLLIIGGLIHFLPSCKGQSLKINEKQSDSDTSKIKKQGLKENPYDGLRKMAFEVTVAQLGLTDLKTDDIYGVIMDWDLGEGLMTLVTYKTGDASMYLSSGGGVIGGGQHDNVNKASKQFIKLADEYLDKAVKTDIAQIPDKNCVRFYFLTTNGYYYAQEQMINFENNTSQWLNYFEEANKVITELRMTTEKK